MTDIARLRRQSLIGPTRRSAGSTHAVALEAAFKAARPRTGRLGARALTGPCNEGPSTLRRAGRAGRERVALIPGAVGPSFALLGRPVAGPR